MTREITLSRGRVTVVDDDDYEWLMTGGKWHAGGYEPHLYAVRTVWEGKHCYGQRMHRLLLPTDQMVDHINGDTLDNRRANLREATPSQNAANRKRRSDSNSLFKGIQRSLVPHAPWLASITVRGEFHYLGVFETQRAAARAYDSAARDYFGEYARVNFPKKEEVNV